jgi:S-DNA-T family DNA segregation ATPase FtsK/SpoIIIE
MITEKDELYETAKDLVLNTGQASTSFLQRRLRLGYARAARILDLMEQDGLVGPPQGSRPREILLKESIVHRP